MSRPQLLWVLAAFGLALAAVGCLPLAMLAPHDAASAWQMLSGLGRLAVSPGALAVAGIGAAAWLSYYGLEAWRRDVFPPRPARPLTWPWPEGLPVPGRLAQKVIEAVQPVQGQIAKFKRGRPPDPRKREIMERYARVGGMMTDTEFAKQEGIDPRTLRNWKKELDF